MIQKTENRMQNTAGRSRANAGIYVNYWCSENSVLLLAIAPVVSLCVFFSGCAAPTVEQAPRICADKSIDEIMQVLHRRRENVVPLRAGGSMRIRWYDSEKKVHQENLNVVLRFYPPDRIYFRGNTILGETVRLGTNADEFWILMKPGQISTYQWGVRSRVETCSREQWLNPQNLLEALGMVSVDAAWSLSNQGDLDVLARTGARGKVVEKVYVNCSDYLPERIEYYGAEGQLTIALELDEYIRLGNASPVPTRISITHSPRLRRVAAGHEMDTVADITLKNVKLFEPSPKQLAGLFARPEPKGFEHIFKLNDNCEFVEQ